jgi:hypothetical protein
MHLLMKHISRYLLISVGLLLTIQTQAQTPRKVIVEHFTNTRCGICGSRNPGLFTNLSSSPEVMHMAVHPSRPYASCVLSQHNPTENDDRAKYYGIFGGTPRVVVQGEAKPVSQNFGAKSLYSDELGDSSAIGISLTTLKKNADSLVVRVVLRVTENHSLTDMNLYIAAAEDTVFYNAPNGEKTHYNVFRKVLINQSVQLPSAVGDSIVLFARTDMDSDWEAERMFAIAMLQNSSTKSMEQVEWSKGQEAEQTTLSVAKQEKYAYQVYPNPATSILYLSAMSSGNTEYRVLNLEGQTVLSGAFISEAQISLEGLKSGMYFISLASYQEQTVYRFMKR